MLFVNNRFINEREVASMGLGDFKKMAGDLASKKLQEQFNVDALLSDSFIKEDTSLNSVKELVNKSGFDVKSIADFKDVPERKLDSYIKSISSFGSWKDLLTKAVQFKQSK